MPFAAAAGLLALGIVEETVTGGFDALLELDAHHVCDVLAEEGLVRSGSCLFCDQGLQPGAG